MNSLLEKWVKNWYQDTAKFDIVPQGEVGYLNHVDAFAVVYYIMEI